MVLFGIFFPEMFSSSVPYWPLTLLTLLQTATPQTDEHRRGKTGVEAWIQHSLSPEKVMANKGSAHSPQPTPPSSLPNLPFNFDIYPTELNSVQRVEEKQAKHDREQGERVKSSWRHTPGKDLRRRVIRRPPSHASIPHGSKNYKVGWGPPEYDFSTIDSDVDFTIEEYYHNLAQLPDFIRNYQSSHQNIRNPDSNEVVDPFPPPNESDDHHAPNDYKLLEVDGHPGSPLSDRTPTHPHYLSHEIPRPKDGGEGPTSHPPHYFGPVKYIGCRAPYHSHNEEDVVLIDDRQKTEEENIPEFQPIPDFQYIEYFPNVQIEPVPEENLGLSSENMSDSKTDPPSEISEEEFEKRYPQIFGEYHLPVVTKVNKTEPNQILLVTNHTKSNSNDSRVVTQGTVPPETSTSTSTTTTTVTPESSSSTTTTTPPPVQKMSTPTEIPTPASIDMSASISTEIHYDQSEDTHFKEALLEGLIRKIQKMEKRTPPTNHLLPSPPNTLRRKGTKESPGTTSKPMKEDRFKILKSAIRKLLRIRSS